MSTPCCLRNCYGNTLNDLYKALKAALPLAWIKFLLDLERCPNSQSRRNGMANFNALNIFAAKKLMDEMNAMNNDGARFDLSDATASFQPEFLIKILNDFDSLLCSGYGQELTDLDKLYNNGLNGSNNGLLFPDGLTDDEKNQILNGFLDNNNYNDSLLNPDALRNLGIVTNTDNSTDDNNQAYPDNLFSITGNPLINIPDDELMNLTLTNQYYKCFQPEFDLQNYIFMDNKSRPLITADKITSLKKLHNEILLPIYNYYYGQGSNPTCQMKIIFALGDLKYTVTNIAGSSFARHLRGEAADFSLVGVTPSKLIQDIRDGNLLIDFGVITAVNGIHITLPYTFQDMDIRGVVLSSPNQSLQSLKVDFVL